MTSLPIKITFPNGKRADLTWWFTVSLYCTNSCPLCFDKVNIRKQGLFVLGFMAQLVTLEKTSSQCGWLPVVACVHSQEAASSGSWCSTDFLLPVHSMDSIPWSSTAYVLAWVIPPQLAQSGRSFRDIPSFLSDSRSCQADIHIKPPTNCLNSVTFYLYFNSWALQKFSESWKLCCFPFDCGMCLLCYTLPGLQADAR